VRKAEGPGGREGGFTKNLQAVNYIIPAILIRKLQMSTMQNGNKNSQE
jgi:hypothetical protein